MPRLVRKQVYITAEQEELLKEVASREKRTEADIIRTALDARLRPRPAASRRLSEDSLWSIVALGAGSVTDVSENVDAYVYGVPHK